MKFVKLSNYKFGNVYIAKSNQLQLDLFRGILKTVAYDSYKLFYRIKAIKWIDFHTGDCNETMCASITLSI